MKGDTDQSQANFASEFCLSGNKCHGNFERGLSTLALAHAPALDPSDNDWGNGHRHRAGKWETIPRNRPPRGAIPSIPGIPGFF